MRIGNPSVRRWVSKSQRGELAVEIEPATYKGVYGKAALFALLTIISAVVTEIAVFMLLNSEQLVEALAAIVIAVVVCVVLLVIMSIVIAFVPSAARVLGILYSILQGGLLGCLALVVDIFVPGISLAAFLGTAIVFLISLAVNKLLEVKISSKFMRGVMIVLFSLIVVEMIMWALSSFGLYEYIGAMWWIQLAVTALCVIWATIMLTWDLQNIDYLVQSGADKKYEWNVAFSLITTLVYLYVEILELLLRLAVLFSNKKK